MQKQLSGFISNYLPLICLGKEKALFQNKLYCHTLKTNKMFQARKVVEGLC